VECSVGPWLKVERPKGWLRGLRYTLLAGERLTVQLSAVLNVVDLKFFEGFCWLLKLKNVTSCKKQPNSCVEEEPERASVHGKDSKSPWICPA
jgi:hypothetical protein